MTTQPLDGITVIELGELVAGPFIGTLLGEFGAEVIKIERPGRGDVLRGFGPAVDGESLYWLSQSRNKKSVVLDLKTNAGVDVLKQLIGKADVVINSLRPGTLEKWGLTEERMRADHPNAVLIYSSGFGRTGPNASKGGYDPVAQGFSGLSNFTGDAAGSPMRAGGSIPLSDFLTGVLGALGAVLSLYARDASGNTTQGGQTVDVALYDTAYRMIAPLVGYYDLSGEAIGRNGNHSLGGAPTGHFETADDRWICTSVQNNEQFHKLGKLIDCPEWMTDARYQTTHGRTEHRDTICGQFADWVKTKKRGEVISAFDEIGLVAGVINSVEDLAEDAHLDERGHSWVDDPQLGRYRSPDVVPRLSDTPGGVRARAPSLGADTRAVLKTTLGFSDDECQRLEDAGTLGTDAQI